MTLYRTSGDSPIVRSLIRAAERGKQVAAHRRAQGPLRRERQHRVGPGAGERGRPRRLRARRAQDARQDGCWSCARRPTACGATATSAPATTTPRRPASTRTWGCSRATRAIGADLTQLFNELTGYGRNVRLPAAAGGAPRCCARARRPDPGRDRGRAAEPGRGRIIMKMNSLVDPAMIDELYARLAGRRRDRPDRAGHLLPAPGRARAVGEHPGAVDRGALPRALPHLPLRQRRRPGRPAHLIGSADLMPRNLDRRVEVLTPVVDPELQARLRRGARRRAGRRRAGLDAGRRRPLDAGCRPGGAIETHARLQGSPTERRGAARGARPTALERRVAVRLGRLPGSAGDRPGRAVRRS